MATSEGARNIEDVRPGDEVVAYDAEVGERSTFQVKEVYTRVVDELVLLQVDGIVIETTAEHPFWVDGTGFVPAGKLIAGDQLVGMSGERRAVEQLDRLRGTFTVHNIHVGGAHTYFVSDLMLLVHNMKAMPMMAF